MNWSMNPTPLFRPSGARKESKRFARRKSWVRPWIHYAIRWTSFFFLRPWDGVVLPRLGRIYRKCSGVKINPGMRIPGKTEKSLLRTLWKAHFSRIRNRFFGTGRNASLRESFISAGSHDYGDPVRIEDLPLLPSHEIAPLYEEELNLECNSPVREPINSAPQTQRVSQKTLKTPKELVLEALPVMKQ